MRDEPMCETGALVVDATREKHDLSSTNGHGDMARLLIRCGADRRIRDTGGLTPGEFAAEHGHIALSRYLDRDAAGTDE